MTNEGQNESQVRASQTQTEHASPSGTQEPAQSSQERQPIATAPISVILPVYDDKTTAQHTVAEWVKALDSLDRDYEILLVDDAGPHGISSLPPESVGPRVRPIPREGERGLGAALRSGLAAAQFPLILFSTCDGRYQPADLHRFLKWIDKVDMVCGFRSSQGGEFRPTWTDRIYRCLMRVVFALRLRDPQCHYLLARRDIFARIPVQTNGPFGFTEVLAKANFLGCLMHETPVSYLPRAEAEAKWVGTSLRDRLAGLRQVFFKPDFGPPTLPPRTNIRANSP